MRCNTFFHVIPYIYYPMIGLLMFQGTTLVIQNINWVEQARKVFCGATTNSNIPGLVILLNKMFSSPTAELVIQRYRYPMQWYMDSCFSTMLVKYVTKVDRYHSRNLPSNLSLSTQDWVVVRGYRDELTC